MKLAVVAACGMPSIAETLETRSADELWKLANQLSEDFEFVDIHVLSSNGGLLLERMLSFRGR